MSENVVLASIESAAVFHKICVLPRNPSKLPVSVWKMPDPNYHVGVIWRQNVGGFQKGKSFIRLGLPGIPDFIGFRFATGQFWTIEAKASKGTLSPDQAAFANLCVSTGVLTGVVRSYEDANALFKRWLS